MLRGDSIKAQRKKTKRGCNRSLSSHERGRQSRAVGDTGRSASPPAPPPVQATACSCIKCRWRCNRQKGSFFPIRRASPKCRSLSIFTSVRRSKRSATLCYPPPLRRSHPCLSLGLALASRFSPCPTSQPGVRPRSGLSRLAMPCAPRFPLLAAAPASPRALQSFCSCDLGRHASWRCSLAPLASAQLAS